VLLEERKVAPDQARGLGLRPRAGNISGAEHLGLHGGKPSEASAAGRGRLGVDRACLAGGDRLRLTTAFRMRDHPAMSATLSWREVLAQWCEPRPAIAPAPAPAPLAAFLGAGGAAALSFQNRFQAPVDEHGWSVFYVENQGVCHWAYRTDDQDADPDVYVCETGGDHVGVGCRLDAFLSAAAVTEAVMGAEIPRAGEGPADDLDRLLGLERVELPHLGWPLVQARYYNGPDVLAFAHLVTDDWAYVFVGAQSSGAIREIDLRLRSSPDWTIAF
jgi:hypothetical protein